MTGLISVKACLQRDLFFLRTLESLPQTGLPGSQLTDHAVELAQPFLRGGVLSFHLLLGLLECRRGILHLPCEVDLVLLKFVDLFDEPLRLGFGAVELGFRRCEIGDGCVVGALRYTGAAGDASETQYPSCCSVDLQASPRYVDLNAIAQRATPAVTPTSRCRAGYPFL